MVPRKFAFVPIKDGGFFYFKMLKCKSTNSERRFEMSDKIKDKNVDFLFEAILNLQTMEECYDFFEDLCTVTEIKSISQRIAAVRVTMRYS